MGSSLAPPLGIGFTAESFHSPGSAPDRIDLLNRIMMVLVMELVVAFNMVAEMPSGPLAFVVSSDKSRASISSSEQRRLGGQSSELAFKNVGC